MNLLKNGSSSTKVTLSSFSTTTSLTLGLGESNSTISSTGLASTSTKLTWTPVTNLGSSFGSSTVIVSTGLVFKILLISKSDASLVVGVTWTIVSVSDVVSSIALTLTDTVSSVYVGFE